MTDEKNENKKGWMDQNMPGWRDLKHANGAPMYSASTGTLLDGRGNRSIFDDVDE